MTPTDQNTLDEYGYLKMMSWVIGQHENFRTRYGIYGGRLMTLIDLRRIERMFMMEYMVIE